MSDITSDSACFGIFRQPEKQINTLVDGDDYVSAGDDTSMTWLEAELSKAYDIQTQKLSTVNDMQQEGKVLDRILRCTQRSRRSMRLFYCRQTRLHICG